ncbi:hypothetical protein SPBR_00904 [Sporothrix brasiliensis 5110]|uniref:Fungal-type protein kinase domain-containing protein n=1 Tax=Sporothrix brasiliensis 5110 TaxID=1398154 RepID=A0A0C2IL63_9PEZI|nr:uncharacterized protein SPBR_00904 [Sporothrix brasiliensis 5110]KIH89846.1 hypothetical protein SPBR_00904 [Sporothrix brasiliensis 5110]
MGLLLDSFDEALELGRYLVTPPTRPLAVASGESTRRAEEPKVRINVPFSVWNSFANAALQAMEAGRHFANESSPKWNDARYIDVEGDVAEASSMYLLHAIDSVLSAYLPAGSFRFMSQHTLHGDNFSVRADRIWGLGIPDTLDLGAYFAILDFKRPTLIDPNDFGRALTWYEFNRRNSTGYLAPSFENNSQVLLKQAVSYSNLYQTKFVAFFDWHTLVLVVLADAQRILGGQYCFVTIVTDRKKMMRALLGFLVRAYNARINPVEDYTDLAGSGNLEQTALSKGKRGTGGLGSGSGESSRHRRR